MIDRRSDLLDVLDDFEDFLTSGYRSKRGERILPDLPVVAPAASGGPSAGPGEPPAETDAIGEIAREVAGCKSCGLWETRKNTVPGIGVRRPVVLVVGEGPGAEEDRTGIPFVGPAGRYLDKWLAAIDLSRETNCYIGNVVKCRPPGNRDPEEDEVSSCIGYLERQVDELGPRAILTVGKIATQVLTGQSRGIGSMRGSTYSYRGIPLVPTYHPSAVLRDPDYRPRVWEDLKRLKDLLV